MGWAYDEDALAMVTAKDIERARRVYVAAMNTPRELVARDELRALVRQAKREQAQRDARLS